MWKSLFGLLIAFAVASCTEGTDQKRSASISCYNGTQISGLFNQGSLTLAQCGEGSACASTYIEMGLFITAVYIRAGYCVPADTCADITCKNATDQIPDTVPLKVMSCQMACCYTTGCNDPTNPLVNGTRPSVTTSPPVTEDCESHMPNWNETRGENWPLGGRKRKPMFQLKVKKIKKGLYKQNKAHKLLIGVKNRKSGVKIAGAYIVLRRLEGTCDCGAGSCELGAFIGSKQKSLPSGCDQPLVVEISPKGAGSANKLATKWKSPLCGNVVISAVVKGTDGKIYRDDDQSMSKRKLLTAVLRPST